MAGRERVAQHGDLEARGGHEGEEARPRLRDRVVEHDRGLVERLQHGRRLECDRCGQRGAQQLADRRLIGPRLVEAVPGLCDQPGHVRERFCRAARRAAAPVPIPPYRPWCNIRRVIPELSDDQREVQALVREFCQREVAPHTAEWDSGHRVPMEALRSLAELGVLGRDGARGARRSRSRSHHALPGGRGTGASRRRALRRGRRARRPDGRADQEPRHARAAGAPAAAARERRAARLLCTHRARRRQRHREHSHTRGARRRRLAVARHQDLDHERRLRRRRDRVRPHRRARAPAA